VLVAIDGYESRSLGTTALAVVAAAGLDACEAMIHRHAPDCAARAGGAYAREQKAFLAALMLPTIIGTGTWLPLPAVRDRQSPGTASMPSAVGELASSALRRWYAAGCVRRTALHRKLGCAAAVLAVLLVVAVFRAGKTASARRVAAAGGALLTIEVVSIFFIRSYSRVTRHPRRPGDSPAPDPASCCC